LAPQPSLFHLAHDVGRTFDLEEAGIFQFIVGVFQGLYWTFLWSDSIGKADEGLQPPSLAEQHQSTHRRSEGSRQGVHAHPVWWLRWVAAFDSDTQAIDEIVDTVVVVEP